MRWTRFEGDKDANRESFRSHTEPKLQCRHAQVRPDHPAGYIPGVQPDLLGVVFGVSRLGCEVKMGLRRKEFCAKEENLRLRSAVGMGKKGGE